MSSKICLRVINEGKAARSSGCTREANFPLRCKLSSHHRAYSHRTRPILLGHIRVCCSMLLFTVYVYVQPTLFAGCARSDPTITCRSRKRVWARAVPRSCQLVVNRRYVALGTPPICPLSVADTTPCCTANSTLPVSPVDSFVSRLCRSTRGPLITPRP